MESSLCSLPKIAWTSHRGTLTCRADSNLQTIEYAQCPNALQGLTIQELIDQVPEINKIVQITDKFEGSYIGDAKLLLETMKWIRNLDPELPVLLTIGTNILHDIAFFLDVTLDRPGPIVLTGAMRPISALSSDAPYNLIQACALAVHPSTRGRGVMLLFSDRITPAFYGIKTSANRMDTFKSFEAGHLGIMNNLTPHFFYEHAKATNKPYFDIPEHVVDLPKVALIHCYMDMERDELDRRLKDEETKGIVIAGFGNASIWPAWIETAVEVSARNYPIVRTSLHADSHTTPMYLNRCQIASGDLGPFKSYLLLRLAIAVHGQDIEKIRQTFGTNFEPIAVPK